jgi:hypothetical protein
MHEKIFGAIFALILLALIVYFVLIPVFTKHFGTDRNVTGGRDYHDDQTRNL